MSSLACAGTVLCVCEMCGSCNVFFWVYTVCVCCVCYYILLYVFKGAGGGAGRERTRKRRETLCILKPYTVVFPASRSGTSHPHYDMGAVSKQRMLYTCSGGKSQPVTRPRWSEIRPARVQGQRRGCVRSGVDSPGYSNYPVFLLVSTGSRIRRGKVEVIMSVVRGERFAGGGMANLTRVGGVGALRGESDHLTALRGYQGQSFGPQSIFRSPYLGGGALVDRQLLPGPGASRPGRAGKGTVLPPALP